MGRVYNSKPPEIERVWIWCDMYYPKFIYRGYLPELETIIIMCGYGRVILKTARKLTSVKTVWHLLPKRLYIAGITKTRNFNGWVTYFNFQKPNPTVVKPTSVFSLSISLYYPNPKLQWTGWVTYINYPNPNSTVVKPTSVLIFFLDPFI